MELVDGPRPSAAVVTWVTLRAGIGRSSLPTETESSVKTILEMRNGGVSLRSSTPVRLPWLVSVAVAAM
jgi:hypothetical protein